MLAGWWAKMRGKKCASCVLFFSYTTTSDMRPTDEELAEAGDKLHQMAALMRPFDRLFHRHVPHLMLMLTPANATAELADGAAEALYDADADEAPMELDEAAAIATVMGFPEPVLSIIWASCVKIYF
jgi:hypothetical protein